MQNYEIILILYHFRYKKYYFLTILYQFEYSSNKENGKMRYYSNGVLQISPYEVFIA